LSYPGSPGRVILGLGKSCLHRSLPGLQLGRRHSGRYLSLELKLLSSSGDQSLSLGRGMHLLRRGLSRRDDNGLCVTQLGTELRVMCSSHGGDLSLGFQAERAEAQLGILPIATSALNGAALDRFNQLAGMSLN
jgi:hypothetical protein